MKEETLLNLIRDIFHKNFEYVIRNKEEGFITQLNRSIAPIASVNGFKPPYILSSFSKGDILLGTRVLNKLYLKVDNFEFTISYIISNEYNCAIPVDTLNESPYYYGNRYDTSKLLRSTVNNKVTYQHILSIDRIGDRGEVLLNKEIKINSDYYNRILDAIQYNEARMYDELNILLTKSRTDKIDKIMNGL